MSRAFVNEDEIEVGSWYMTGKSKLVKIIKRDSYIGWHDGDVYNYHDNEGNVWEWKKLSFNWRGSRYVSVNSGSKTTLFHLTTSDIKKYWPKIIKGNENV